MDMDMDMMAGKREEELIVESFRLWYHDVVGKNDEFYFSREIKG